MRQSQRASYADRIERALDHLVERLTVGDNPGLQELADQAALSAYHFHRIFRLMTGETIGEVTTRLRLAASVSRLEAGDTVTQAAAASGYATSQSYARALHKHSGSSATMLLSEPGALRELKARLRVGTRERPEDKTPIPIALEITTTEPLRLLAIRNIGDYAELNTTYTALFDAVLKQVSPEHVNGIYGIPYDDPISVTADDCRCDCGLHTAGAGQPDGPLFELILPGGTYARIRHQGNYDAVYLTIDLAYSQIFKQREWTFADQPVFIHYWDDPEEMSEAELRANVFIPLLRTPAPRETL